MKAYIIVLFSVLILVALSSCSTTNFVKGSASKIEKAAMLPLEVPDDISRERAATIRRLVTEELENKGYLFLDDVIIQQLCGNSYKCPERDQLVTKFGAQGVFELRVKSLARTNLVAAYFNSISGNLTLKSSAGEDIFTVSRSERERGGLLFNTGQVAQGIKESLDNSSADRGFNFLAAEFAKNLVKEVPPIGANRKEGSSVAIDALELKNLVGDTEQLCASGTPSGLAALVSGNFVTNLREVSPGRYCGIFKSADLPTTELVVVLKTAFGDSARRKVERATSSSSLMCEIKKSADINFVNNRAKIDLHCDSISPVKQFLVYSAPSELGPFSKIGQFAGQSWIAPKASSQNNLFALVPVLESGERQSPVLISPKNG